MRLALPEAIVVNDKTATLTSPVGVVAEVWDATSVTAPPKFAVLGFV